MFGETTKNIQQKAPAVFAPNSDLYSKLKVSRGSISPTMVEVSGDAFDTSSTPHGAKWESKKEKKSPGRV